MAKGRKTGGRKKGTLNKRTQDLEALLEEMKFCPARALVRSYRLAMKQFKAYDQVAEKILDSDADVEVKDLRRLLSSSDAAPTYLRIAETAAKELMQYRFPKRKAVEITGKDGEELEAVQVIVGIPKNGSEAD